MECGWSKVSLYILAGATIQRLETEQIYQSPQSMTRWNLDSYSLSQSAQCLSKICQTVKNDWESLTGSLFKKYTTDYPVLITILKILLELNNMVKKRPNTAHSGEEPLSIK